MNDRGGAVRRPLVIYNPMAGRRRRRLLDRVLDALGATGAVVTLVETAYPGHAETIAQTARSGCYDALVAAGGDGTINEIVNGMSGGDLPLAVVPIGTVNVLANEIDMPLGSAALAAVIAAGRRRRIHLGEVGGRLFTMMAGIGFDAQVVDGVDLGLKRRIGKLAYGVETVRRMAVWGLAPYRITIDGVAHDCASAIAAKGRYYGGRFVAAPDARLANPSLDVVLFQRSGRGAALRYALALAIGRLDRLADVRVVRGREVVVAGHDGEPVQADGDIIARLPATIRLADATIQVIAP
jgi:YegS/Rv2252/BmrU family lipid kinase